MSPNRPIRDRAICLAGKGGQEGGILVIESRWPPTSQPYSRPATGRNGENKVLFRKDDIFPLRVHGDPDDGTREIYPLLRCEPLRSHISVRESVGFKCRFFEVKICTPSKAGHFLALKRSQMPISSGAISSLHGCTQLEQEPTGGEERGLRGVSKVSDLPSIILSI